MGTCECMYVLLAKCVAQERFHYIFKGFDMQQHARVNIITELYLDVGSYNWIGQYCTELLGEF